jgi:protein-disulfide isomerase
VNALALHNPRLTVPISERDHVLGSPTAAVTLLEYGDYQCPYCGAAHPSVKQVRRLLGDDLLFAYRHFPTTQIHPFAFPAAEAAEAAGAQGRFWEMHDLLFTNQDRLAPGDLLGYAQTLDLDVEPFASDLREHTFAARIREDFMSGVRSGVNGTPTFFINGVRHNGGHDSESLLAALSTVPAAAF